VRWCTWARLAPSERTPLSYAAAAAPPRQVKQGWSGFAYCYDGAGSISGTEVGRPSEPAARLAQLHAPTPRRKPVLCCRSARPQVTPEHAAVLGEGDHITASSGWPGAARAASHRRLLLGGHCGLLSALLPLPPAAPPPAARR
jgi:hypothetical protein